MIVVDGLSRLFGTTVALDGISFAVEAGEIVGLLGPNGAGKTTCLRILAGLLAPSGGRARIQENDVVARSLAARAAIGYLPEEIALYPELRTIEYLRFRARLRGLPRRRRGEEVERVIDLCRLDPVRRGLLGQLSRGYRQRVGLAAALIGDPPILLLDEPTTGLDPNQTREVQQLLGRLAGERAVLLSSHLLAQVEAICARVLILQQGRIVADGTLEELRSRGGEGRVTAVVRGPAEAVAGMLGAREDLRLERVTPLEGDPAVVEVVVAGPGGAELRERVAQAVISAGWALQQLRGEGAVLDEIFARLTAGEAEER
jgi:ABC-2 type transport system ATP-binding protein